MKRGSIGISVLLAFLAFQLSAQDDLLNLLDEDTKTDSLQPEPINYVSATFKGTKIINMQSPEIPGKGVLQFIIMHRFGALNDDFIYNFFGLEQASTRFSFDYSFSDWFNIGVGRSSASKTYDGFVKAKILRQSTGGKNIPISLVAYASMNYNTTRWTDGLPHNESDRLSYAYQLIIARKMNEWLSLELVPMMVHYNLVETRAQPNDLFALGIGGRIKVNQRIAITGEYALQLNQNTYLLDGRETEYSNALTIGVDIETGGHVFQLHLTNARGMADPEWIGKTPGSWSNGDIYLGFNISRVFTIVRPKTPEEPAW